MHKYLYTYIYICTESSWAQDSIKMERTAVAVSIDTATEPNTPSALAGELHIQVGIHIYIYI